MDMIRRRAPALLAQQDGLVRRIPEGAPYHRRTREIDIVTRGVGEYLLNLAILGWIPKVHTAFPVAI